MSILLRWRTVRLEEKGQGLVEYALLILLIALPTVTAVMLFGDRVGELYRIIRNAFP